MAPRQQHSPDAGQARDSDVMPGTASNTSGDRAEFVQLAKRTTTRVPSECSTDCATWRQRRCEISQPPRPCKDMRSNLPRQAVALSGDHCGKEAKAVGRIHARNCCRPLNHCTWPCKGHPHLQGNENSGGQALQELEVRVQPGEYLVWPKLEPRLKAWVQSRVHFSNTNSWRKNYSTTCNNFSNRLKIGTS